MYAYNSFGALGGYHRSDTPLSDNQLMKCVPSVFAESPHESRSSRYTYIPTIDVLNALRKEGFAPFSACQSRTREEGRQAYARHMIRLRHADQINSQEPNEIILLNSHDGTSSYQMLAGMFRFVCSNGMVCGNTVGEVRVRHQGDVIHNVIEGAYTVLNEFDVTQTQREQMKEVVLSSQEQRVFATAALPLRYDEQKTPAPVTPDQLLQCRRSEDRNNNLWTTFNCVQENMLKGGLWGRNRNGKITRTRAINGIDQNVKLNRALWTLANEMRKLK